MLAQRHKRLLPLIGGAIILLYVLFEYTQISSVPLSAPSSDHIHEHASPSVGETSEKLHSVASIATTKTEVADVISASSTSSTPSASSSPPKSSSASSISSTSNTSQTKAIATPSAKEETNRRPGEEAIPFKIEPANREIFSVSTIDKKFFYIKFGHKKGINPNIIPHPHFNDTWIIVAMQHDPSPLEHSVWYVELVCNAVFMNDTLTCLQPPQILPIAATEGHGDLCPEPLGWFVFNIGPHDARVFYGPKDPYTIYGSNSGHTCFGQFIQDFRLLMDWGLEYYDPRAFRQGTEMQRPKPWNLVEKNFFLFWDNTENETMHAHYDIYPKRVFAEIGYDGTAGPDLAPLAAATDEKCLKAYMPQVAKEHESIHQATNSLQITLCKRSDDSCKQSNNNTFILTIFQHKTFYDLHGVYYPYVILFSQSAPFEIYAISKKPLWFSGRGVPGGWTKPNTSFISENIPNVHTQMLYTTSVSWKQKGMKYAGYLDDVMFVTFGVEDADTGAIDVLAGDLLQDLGICSEL